MPYTEDELQNLSIYTSFRDKLRSGYIKNLIQAARKTFRNEDGVLLSGGQRQRLAIARTILLNPSVLILDDSTSSVDLETERLIRQAFIQLIEGRTTFVIAHRLSTIKSADLILVLKDGEIVERGTHRTLLELAGAYREIYELQLKPQDESMHPGITGREYA